MPPRKRSGPATGPLRKVPPASVTTESLPQEGDPRRVGELLGDWLAIRMDEVDALVDEAEAKVAVLPDQRHLWLLLGETLVRLHCLELEVAELRKAVRR
jgi:cytochrome c-type biogenesis protein CcmH/NrfG